MTKPLRLVILDTDEKTAQRLAMSLGTDGVVAYAATDVDEAFRLIALLQHEILVIDVGKLICTPIYPLQAFRQAKSDLRIVGISRGPLGNGGVLLELLALDAYLREPVTPEALILSSPELADLYSTTRPRKTSPLNREHLGPKSQPSWIPPFFRDRRSHSAQA